MVYGDGQAGPCMASVHGVGAWVVVHGIGVSINDVVYYLDSGVAGLVRLDLGIGVWFWMRYGDVISGGLLHEMDIYILG